MLQHQHVSMPTACDILVRLYLESKSLGKNGKANLCNLILNSGFRLVGLRPHSFFISTVSVRVFYEKIVSYCLYIL